MAKYQRKKRRIKKESFQQKIFTSYIF